MGDNASAGGSWVDALDDGQAIRAAFGEAGDFAAVELHEVLLDRNGPLLRLRLGLPITPVLPRGRAGADAGSVVLLEAWDAHEVHVEGWQRDLPGRLSVHADVSGRTLVFEGAGCTIRARFATLRAQGVAPPLPPRAEGPQVLRDGTAVPMDLYEVVRWGNDSDDPVTGGGNGPDTCFLVLATSVEEAAAVADYHLALDRDPGEADCASVVQLLGSGHAAPRARLVRGPYVQTAYTFGPRQWARAERGEPWIEVVARR